MALSIARLASAGASARIVRESLSGLAEFVPSECRVASWWTSGEPVGGVGGHGAAPSPGEGVGDVVEVEPLRFGALVGLVVGSGDVAVDDVEPVGVLAAGDGDVALLEAGQVGRVVAGGAMGGALDAVAGAGVAVLETPRRQVRRGDSDRALTVEGDGDLAVVRVQRR